MHGTVRVTNTLDGVLDTRHLSTVFQHSLAYVKRKTQKVLGKVVLVYFPNFVFHFPTPIELLYGEFTDEMKFSGFNSFCCISPE